jgi:hypothetical protein
MRIITTISLFLISHLSMAQSPVIDSIIMGAGYANQIYYKLGSGQTGQQIAADWHLAVSVQPSIPPTQTLQGTTIRINGGYGIELYKVSDTDSSGFNTLDNANNMANWQQLRDDYTNWDEGCLNSTRSTTEPFDYGWGKYRRLDIFFKNSLRQLQKTLGKKTPVRYVMANRCCQPR